MLGKKECLDSERGKCKGRYRYVQDKDLIADRKERRKDGTQIGGSRQQVISLISKPKPS